MTFYNNLALAAFLGLALSAPSAWSVEATPAPALDSGEANAFALQTAAGGAILGGSLFGIVEMMRASDAKDSFIPARPLYGLAIGGAAGGAASGLGLALFVDKQPTWWGAATGSLLGLAAGAGGALWLNQLERRTPPDETAYTVVSLTLPVISAMLSSLTYQGIRMLTTPQPSPTPTPLQTPWPTPSPPVRLFL
jgi:hypothetical protein